MSGKYGTVWEYIRAYDHYGGKPPIPEESGVRRGDSRPLKSRVLGVCLGLALWLGLMILGFEAAEGLAPPLFGLVMFSVGVVAVCLDQAVITPVQDWYDDTPRKGLKSTEYGIVPVSSEGRT